MALGLSTTGSALASACECHSILAFSATYKSKNANLTTLVSDVPGQTVRFRKAGFLGGIEEGIGRWKDHETVRESDVQEFQTTSLTEILLKANAPRFIHYMSIDIEGAELDALKGLDFSQYQVGAFTIEHNFEEPKRAQIRQLLEREGYRFARSSAQDDFYLLAEHRRN